MWEWGHFKDEGWLVHTKRSAQYAALLLASGVAMILHMLIPFWQQPKALQRESVAAGLCPDEKTQEPEENPALERDAAQSKSSDEHWIDAKGRIRPGRRRPGNQKKE
jgi:hypothetical protein